MRKLIMSAATALAGLILTGFVPTAPISQGPDDEDVLIKKAEPDPAVVADPAAQEGQDEPAECLREAYSLLRQLRSEPLQEERPRELLARATDLYRDGVKAFERGEAAEARNLGSAARELARVIRLSRAAHRDEPDDLPPPPGTPRQEGVTAKMVERLSPGALPPPLPTDDAGSKAQQVQEYLIERRVEPRVVEVPDGEGGRQVRVYVAPEGGEARADVLIPVQPRAVAPKMVRQPLRLEALRQLQGQAKEGARLAIVGDGNIVLSQADTADRARGDLRRAYDRIREAREKTPGPEAKFYLDAARDLYNSARRDAQAGRHQRASELARAAEALTLVPKHLADVRPQPKGGADSKDRNYRYYYRLQKGEGAAPKAERFQRKFEFRPKASEPARESEKKEERRIEVRVLPHQDEAARAGDKDEKQDTEAQGKDKAKDDPKPKTPDSETARDDAGLLTGIGVALKFEDDQVVVVEVLPDSPASEDGRIKSGDLLVGVKGVDGEDLMFEGKEPVEVTKLLRGPAGTKVGVLVRSKDSDKSRVVELTRRKLALRETRVAHPKGELPPVLD